MAVPNAERRAQPGCYNPLQKPETTIGYYYPLLQSHRNNKLIQRGSVMRQIYVLPFHGYELPRHGFHRYGKVMVVLLSSLLWHTGISAQTPPPPLHPRDMAMTIPGDFTLASVGDLMIRRPASQTADANVQAVLQLIRDADLAVGNMGRGTGKLPRLRRTLEWVCRHPRSRRRPEGDGIRHGQSRTESPARCRSGGYVLHQCVSGRGWDCPLPPPRETGGRRRPRGPSGSPGEWERNPL